MQYIAEATQEIVDKHEEFLKYEDMQ